MKWAFTLVTVAYLSALALETRADLELHRFRAGGAPSGQLLEGGALAMTALFLGISIPMIERKLLADKRGYQGYRERVPRLLLYGLLKNMK